MIIKSQESCMVLFSDYERQRATNIERNNARLLSLGLITSKEERSSNDAAWGKRPVVHIRPTVLVDRSSSIKSKKRKKKESETICNAVPRRSRRLAGNQAQELSNKKSDTVNHNSPSVTEEQLQNFRIAEAVTRREARLRAAALVFEAGADTAAMENPTASYDHCLMRVRTMSEKGLGNRIRAIERAAGRHCVVKMAIFRSCLMDEGYDELADSAGKALERLKGLLPPPE
mmetsp:Transcript_11603/g.17670  ORF Transcript_11603/g.17670 Transcript_11603/m.17670 type:complete len:230 (+) Transcript_11603:49-738(+)